MTDTAGSAAVIRRVRRRVPARGVATLCTALTVAAAGSVFAGTFRLERILGALLVAAVGPAAVDLVWATASRRRWWAAQTVGFAMAWVAVVLPLERSAGAAATARSLPGGWSEILSTTAPAAVTVATVSVVFVSTWWTSVWSLGLAGRTTRELSPLGPPVLLAIAASMFAPTGELPYSTWPLLFLGAAAAVALTRVVWSPSRVDRIATTSRGTGIATASAGPAGVMVGLGLLSAAVVGGVVVGATGAGVRDDASVLRRWWTPEVVPVAAVDPFAAVSAAIDPDTAELPAGRVRVTGREATGPLRLRLSAADRFDGAAWSNSGRFVRVGDGVRPAAAGRSTDLDMVLMVRQSDRLPFLAVPARVDRIDSEPTSTLAVDESSGMWTASDSEGDGGDGNQRAPAALAAGRYTITGAELPGGAVPASAGSTTTVGRAGKRFEDLAREWAGSGDTIERADRLERSLNGDRAVDGFKPTVVQDAPSDPSVARLASLLDPTPGDPAAASGTPAEFAAAFAVLGRLAGLETRVVLGFELPSPDTGRELQLRQGDLRIWPEALLDNGDGPLWVPFDPVPQTLDRVEDKPEPEPSATGPRQSTPSSVSPPEDGGGTSDTQPVRPVPPAPALVFNPSANWWPWLVGAGVVGATLATMTIGVRRRRRRTKGPPSRRIAAAWDEISRLLARRRVPNANSLTPAQTSAAIIEVFGDSARKAAGQAHHIVDSATFGPEHPTDDDAQRLWAVVDELAGLGRRRQPVTASTEPDI